MRSYFSLVSPKFRKPQITEKECRGAEIPKVGYYGGQWWGILKVLSKGAEKRGRNFKKRKKEGRLPGRRRRVRWLLFIIRVASPLTRFAHSHLDPYWVTSHIFWKSWNNFCLLIPLSVMESKHIVKEKKTFEENFPFPPQPTTRKGLKNNQVEVHPPHPKSRKGLKSRKGVKIYGKIWAERRQNPEDIYCLYVESHCDKIQYTVYKIMNGVGSMSVWDHRSCLQPVLMCVWLKDFNSDEKTVYSVSKILLLVLDISKSNSSCKEMSKNLIANHIKPVYGSLTKFKCLNRILKLKESYFLRKKIEYYFVMAYWCDCFFKELKFLVISAIGIQVLCLTRKRKVLILNLKVGYENVFKEEPVLEYKISWSNSFLCYHSHNGYRVLSIVKLHLG